MKQNPSVAIILLNWNAFRYTADCLESLRLLSYTNFQVIVVDNASHDGSATLLEKQFPEIHLIRNEHNLGFTGGNNVGIAYAISQGYDLLMLLNNDTLVEPNFMTPLVERLMSDESIGAVQPKIMFYHDHSLIWSAGGKYSKWLGTTKTIGGNEKDTILYARAVNVEWITNCCSLVRADIVTRIGGLNEVFFYGAFDDTDWSFRIRSLGYMLFYEPASVIYHHETVAAKGTGNNFQGELKPFFHYLTVRNHLFFLRIHCERRFLLSAYTFQLVKILSYVTYFLLKGRFRKLKASMHGFFHGLILPLDPSKLEHVPYIKKYS